MNPSRSSLGNRSNESKANDTKTLKVLEEYESTFGQLKWDKSGQKFKRSNLKRTNVFQEEEENDVKKVMMRDPRKLKFIAAMGSQGQTNESKVLEESNTLRIQNISNKFTAVMICEMFSLYGSIYSCRLLNDQNIAYVAFTKTEYAKDALENLNEKIFDGLEIKLSYAPKIICNGQVLLEANQSEQITGLPFNAQFVKTSDKSIQKTKVIVKIPPPDQRKVIHQTIQRIFKYGTDYEKRLIDKEKGNPSYDFLTNFNSAEHVYYRWKVFSLKNGDLPSWWKCQPFVMFEGGSTWYSPNIPFEENKMSYPECIEYDSAASASSDSEDDYEDGKKKKYSSKITQMSFYHRTCFEDKLRTLTTYRGDVAEAMIFCMRHSYAAEELANVISDAIMVPEADVYPTKVARLYLLSDILFNASSIPSAWKFRAAFEPLLPDIFAAFGRLAKTVPGKIRQEKFRIMITCTISAWERWVVFPTEFTDKLWLCYKNGSLGVISLESRLQLQQDNRIGLYSHDYESKEIPLCVGASAPKEEFLTDILPVGFKKTDSWISVDHDVGESVSLLADPSENSAAKLEDSDEDLDGVPLHVSKSSGEESEEDLDGVPLRLH